MSEMAGGLLASNSIFIRTLQMPNKSANQILMVSISAHFSSIIEIYYSQISAVS